MNFSFLRSRMVPLLALSCVAGLNSGVAASQLDSLLANSPFGSPKSGQPGDAAGNQPFEFRSVSEEKGGPFFSIYDTATKRSRWVVLNDPSGDLVVKKYNAANNTVSLEQNGRVLVLTLKSGPRVVQNVPSPMAPSFNGQPGQVLPNGAAKGPEAQRLQQIAEEIRRRRALRQQPPQMPMPAPNAVPGNGGPSFIPGSGNGGPTFVPGTGNGGPTFVPNPNPGSGPMPTPVPGSNTGPTPNSP